MLVITHTHYSSDFSVHTAILLTPRIFPSLFPSTHSSNPFNSEQIDRPAVRIRSAQHGSITHVSISDHPSQTGLQIIHHPITLTNKHQIIIHTSYLQVTLINHKQQAAEIYLFPNSLPALINPNLRKCPPELIEDGQEAMLAQIPATATATAHIIPRALHRPITAADLHVGTMKAPVNPL